MPRAEEQSSQVAPQHPAEMAAVPPKIQRFKEAMRLVYGNFDSPPSPYLRAMASASSSTSLSSLAGVGGGMAHKATPSSSSSFSAAAAATLKPETAATGGKGAASSAAPTTTTSAMQKKKRRDTLTPPPSPLLTVGGIPQWAESWTPPSHPGAGGHRGRYLWTDAFGLVNMLTLWKESGNGTYLVLAKRLARRVHEVLGREREPRGAGEEEEEGGGGGGGGEKRYNRLPGATDEEPLKGGLRIGKEDSRGADGDGMYLHYITLWAFALTQLGLASREGEWVTLAAKLLKSVHRAFVREEHVGRKRTLRIVWKVSSDMEHVLVDRMGHLDAVTGLGVVRFISAAAEKLGVDLGKDEHGVGLEREEKDYAEVVEMREKVMGEGEGGNGGAGGAKVSPSRDMLDLGMGLWVAMLPGLRDQESWAGEFVEDSVTMAKTVMRKEGGVLAQKEGGRLAFREFGAVMGLKCCLCDGGYEEKEGMGAGKGVSANAIEADRKYLLGRGDDVLKFWEDFMARSEDEEFEPIALVMYAAALVPGAFRPDYFDSN
ncbi:hypothetical protein MKZ38_010780 [Zalerion maritima]|uniref:Uncharacterized protein n=1 Tax=Zalerion maritima TaxID=339359 RepID=A0AAD5RZL8_9PEZI|nr:hypothetical protein MKZ38_010780 [Zalerion maritima]